MTESDNIWKLLVQMNAEVKQPLTVALHLRIEQDWLDHCKVWEHIPDGIIRDNCYSNTENIDITLLTSGIPIGSVVYVAGAFTKSQALAFPVFKKLSESYSLLFKDTLLKLDSKDLHSHRELYAAIDYSICEKVDVFVGNSVSTFSAMLLLSREREKLKSGNSHMKNIYYNGGG